MRVLFAAAFALAWTTAASAEPASGPIERHSRDLARLIGTWNCQGAVPGNTSVEVYSALADGSVNLENRVRASTGRVGVVLETFRYDQASASWTLSAGANAFFGGLQLRAPAWTEATWLLTGTEIVNDRPRPTRIVYTDLGPLAFRREHQAQSGSVWQDDAQLTCRRDASGSGTVAASPRPPAAASPAAQLPSATPSPAAAPSPSATPSQDAPRARSASSPRRVPGPRGPTHAPSVAPSSNLPPAPNASPAPSALSESSASAAPATPPSPSATPSPSVQPPAHRDIAWKFAPPAPATTPVPRPTPAPQVRDRAYALVGSWVCETIARDPSVHIYSLQSDGSIHMLNRLRLGTQSFEINEVYRYDSGRRHWSNDTEHGAYRGTASQWIADEWVFDGTATERGRGVAVRMVYKALGTGAFRRDFEKTNASAWSTYASETCARGAARMP